MQDIYCQLIPNDDDNLDKYDMIPRIGAFEISVNGVLIYSKILSGMWPHFGGVAERVADAVKNVGEGKDIKEFQTSGMGQQREPRKRKTSNNPMGMYGATSTSGTNEMAKAGGGQPG